MAAMSVLPHSFALLARMLSRPRLAGTLSAMADPLAINLPPLGGGYGGGGTRPIDRPALEVMAALYFEAELERAAIIPVAEILAENRFELQVTDAQAAQLLETFASSMRGSWYRRELREQLFARTFGMGQASTLDGGQAINREFEGTMARACQALARTQNEMRWGTPTSGAVVQVEMTLSTLLDNLARRQFGNTLVAARIIQDQLNAAVALLNHPGLRQLFIANSLWDVVRAILGPDTPDLARIVGRAQSGLRLLEWMAANLDRLSGPSLGQLLAGESELFVNAATWLQATGIEAMPVASPSTPYGPPGVTGPYPAAGMPGGPAPGQGAGRWN